MARTAIVEATKDPSLTEFTVTGPFWLYGDNLGVNEKAILKRPNNEGDGYVDATNAKGQLFVSKYPNTVYCDLPADTYQLDKPLTEQLTSVSYEEE